VYRPLKIASGQVAPALSQLVEKRARLWAGIFFMAFIETMDFGQGKVSAQQIGDGRVIKPMPAQPPFRPRINQAVEHDGLQHLIPTRALTTGGGHSL
jgi:hypothetical protein